MQPVALGGAPGVPYLVKDNEGHGFRNEENQDEFFGAMEASLAKHLQPQASKI